MHLTARDLSKIKYGAGSIVCGLLVAGGCSAAKYGLLGKGAMVSVLPIVGSVAGVALVSFGLLMLYQVNERRNFLASIGKTVQIPGKNHDQKKTSSNPTLLSILKMGAIGIAAASGIYAVAKWAGTGNSSFSAHTGSSAREPVSSFPKPETAYRTKVTSLLGVSDSQESQLPLSPEDVIASQKKEVNFPKFDLRQAVIPFCQRLMTNKSYKTKPIPTNNQSSSNLTITQLTLTNTTLGDLFTKNYSNVQFNPPPPKTQNNQSALDFREDASFNLWKIVPLARDILISFGCSYLAHSISQNVGALLTSLFSVRKRPVGPLLPTHNKFPGKNDQSQDRRSSFPPSRLSGFPYPFDGGSGELVVLPGGEDLLQQYIVNSPTSSGYHASPVFAVNEQPRWGNVPILPVIEEDDELFEIVIDNGGRVETIVERTEEINPDHELIEVIVENGRVIENAGVLREEQHEVQNPVQELSEAVVIPPNAARSQEVRIDIQQDQKLRNENAQPRKQKPKPVDEVWTEIPLKDDHDLPGEISVYIQNVNSEERASLARSNGFRLDFSTIYSLAARFFSNLLPQIKQWTHRKRELKEIKIHLI